MESRLPKPTSLKKPIGKINKTILPTERLKANTVILKSGNNSVNTVSKTRLPLSHDLTNFDNFSSTLNKKRFGGSPELPRVTTTQRSKLRRSRSACDIRTVASTSHPLRLLKKVESTLAPIPARVNNQSNQNLRRSRSACDIQSYVTTKKRPAPTIAPIPSKFSRCEPKKNLMATTSLNRNVAATSKSAINTSAPAKTTAIVSKRIAPYDYKARFNDLLEKHKILKTKFEAASEQLTTLDSLPEQYEQAQNDLYALKEDVKNKNTEIACFQRQCNAQNLKINTLTKELQETKSEFEELAKKYEKVFAEHIQMKKDTEEIRTANIELNENIEYLTHENVMFKDQLFKANIERKDLHNTIMDLKGNIRVFCRVRPALENELDFPLCHWNYIDECTLEIQNLEILASNQKNKTGAHSFSFDHVFHSKSRQQDVFEMVSPMIQSALDGYNICIFAYGQTGSGKTFTMDGAYENLGVIPRTVDLLFESIESYKQIGWTYTIKATFLEIYNEVLYDLLSNEQKDLEIRMANKDNKTEIFVTNITEEKVQNANHLRQLMNIAKMNRATAATVGNERSSRSHAVTRIELIGRHEEKNEILVGTINLVDLAGSESPKTSLRMNETKNINRSLSELTNVILALLQKQDHIPYRNSKLTHLLMPSLGGNSKTLMFINVSPLQDCYVETVKSLRFAASVNACKLTRAKKNKYLNTSGLNV